MKEQIIIVQPGPGQAFLISAGTSGISNNVEMISGAYRAGDPEKNQSPSVGAMA